MDPYNPPLNLLKIKYRGADHFAIMLNKFKFLGIYYAKLPIIIFLLIQCDHGYPNTAGLESFGLAAEWLIRPAKSQVEILLVSEVEEACTNLSRCASQN